MIVSKYFNEQDDYINCICVCRKFKDTLDKFHFNPISVQSLTLFKNIQTQFIRSRNEKLLNVDRFAIWYPVSYSEYLFRINKKFNFKNIVLCEEDRPCHQRVIPKECTSLGDNCFFFSQLKEIILPSSIKQLGIGCFGCASELSKIVMSTNIRTLPTHSFNGCGKLVEINIPYVTSFGGWCFSGCSTLRSIVVSSHLEKIGNECFYGCDSLRSLDIIGDCKEMKCCIPYRISTMLEKRNIHCLNVEYTKEDKDFLDKKIPKGINSLGMYCFENNTKLTSLSIPTTVTSLRPYCFLGCKYLRSLFIPTTVQLIGIGCFSSCDNLKTINFSEKNVLKETFDTTTCDNLVSLNSCCNFYREQEL
ncbi:Leucine rich repeat containing protein BspA family protein [Entamoeba marina]